MKTYPYSWSTVTYTSDNGQWTEDYWNGRDGVVPDVITMTTGWVGSLSGSVYHGPGYTPPDGTLTIDGLPPEPAPAAGTTVVEIGWPGQPYLNSGN